MEGSEADGPASTPNRERLAWLETTLRREMALNRVLQAIGGVACAAGTLEETIRAALRAVCEELDCTIGHAYFILPDQPELIQPVAIWHLPDTERFTPFVAATDSLPFSGAQGLIGLVRHTGRPQWISDVSTAPEFLRREAAAAVGLGAGFALPVTLEDQVVAVLEFFRCAPEEPDERFLEACAHIGRLLGRVFERERSRDVLRAREEYLRYIAIHSRCLLWHGTVEERQEPHLLWRIRVSDLEAAQRFFPLETVPGQHYMHTWHQARLPDDQQRVDNFGDAEVRAGRSYSQEFRARDATGRVRWIREDVSVEPAGPGKWRAVGICVDVTEPREREELLRKVLDTLPVGVWIVNREGRIVRSNPAAERIWGGARYVGQEEYGEYRGWWAESGAPIAPDDWAAARAISRGETSLDEEVVIQAFDGSRKVMLNSAVPLRDADGGIDGAIIVNEDVTEAKRSELRDTAFRSLGEKLNSAVIPEEAARTILQVADDLFGWDSCWLDLCDLHARQVDPIILIDEVDGRRTEVPSPTHELRDESLMMRAIREGPLLLAPDPDLPYGTAEEPLVAFGDRTRASASIMVVPIRVAARTIGALSIQSYTPGRYSQDDLRTLQALADYCAGALERTRAEAERRSLEQQLLQSQKLEAIGRLAGGVAHDFNNMLAVINGYADLLLMRTDLPRSIREPIGEMQNAGVRAAALTSQLLAFSRRSLIQPQVLDLNAVVTNLESMLRRLLGEDVELLIDLQARTAQVNGDRSQLDQVVLNLVVNARDSMPRGGTLRIRTEEVTIEEGVRSSQPGLRPGEYVLLTVSDTGRGMTPDILSRIWEPFFTTKGPGEGSGL
ncbi:MAG: domain S-box protein, partial [Armatimonadetes bacterium]|nr:domain S-box protein [Armatimonadota bacterium]